MCIRCSALSVAQMLAGADMRLLTVRAHWQALGGRLHLQSITQRRVVQLPNGGGRRSYARAVLKKRGRVVSGEGRIGRKAQRDRSGA